MRQPSRPHHCVQVIYDPRDGAPYPDEAAEFAKLVAAGTAKPSDDFLLIVRKIVDPTGASRWRSLRVKSTIDHDIK